MAKYCRECGKKVSFFVLDLICSECKDLKKKKEEEQKELFEAERSNIESSIINSKLISNSNKDFFNRISRKDAIVLYKRICSEFTKDKELDENEIEVLSNIQSAANLTNDDISYVEEILPYIYVAFVKKENKLPTPDIHLEDGIPIILKKGEIIHFANQASLSETKTVRVGYSGGSRGVSFRIMKGVSYRVGAHRGHIIKEEQLVPTSKGALVITNQRLFLHPAPGNKPVSILLGKILSYNFYEKNIEIYKEGREKPYLFSMNSGAVEIFGICLNFLLSQ